MKKHYAFALAVCLLLAASAFAQKSAGESVTGTWVGDWGPSPSDRNQVTVELKADGKALTGMVNPGPNAVALQKGTFDAKTMGVHFEADAKGHSGKMVHYVVHGKVEGSTMSGTWSHDTMKGDFKITKQ